MKRKHLLVIMMALVLGISVFMSGCGSQESIKTTEKDYVIVDVMTAEKGKLSLTNQFVGTVAPKESVYIIPMAQGTVTHTYFEVGDTVQAGDILFEIDDTVAKMQLEQAQLTYNNTKAQVDNSWTGTKDQLSNSLKQLEVQKTAALAQLEGAQMQYFTLLDSVNQANEALQTMKEQYDNIDTMSTDEVLSLAQAMGESMMSSSAGFSGEVDLDSILNSLLGGNLGNSGGNSGSNGDNAANGSNSGNSNNNSNQTANSMTEEEKAQLADELRPQLKQMLAGQIKETESGLKQAQMSLNAAETSMKAAEASYHLLEDSIEQTAGTNLDETKAQLDNSVDLAKLAVDSAELALSYYDVTTPISGTVISKAVSVNGFATSSQPSYVIAGDDTMTVTFFVSESVKNTMVSGAELQVERNGMIYEGAVTEIGNAVNQQTGLFQIKGTIYADGEKLPSGVSVKLSLETYKVDNAIIIPYDAVYYESTGAYVYVMKDDKAVKTTVTTGLFDDTSIEITGGLEVNDRIIISWSPRLIDGAAVQASESTPDLNAESTLD